MMLKTWHSRASLALFSIGLGVSGVMVARSQVTEDQFNLLAIGWRFAFEGEWTPFGIWASGGGAHPGSLTNLFVGLPLLAWADHRAPTLLILASHVLAFVLLDQTLRSILSDEERVLFAALYWLNPWRLLHSGFLWNPNYLFVLGALHLWTAYRMRVDRRFWPTLLHVLALGFAVQFHLSAAILTLASLLLWWRRYVKIHLAGAAAASAVVVAALLPWLRAGLADPSLLPAGEGSIGGGFVAVAPILQGIAHWLRYPALVLSRSMACLDFSAAGGPGHEAMAAYLPGMRLALAAPTLLLSAWASWRLWRRAPALSRRSEQGDPARRWLEGVIKWSFVAALLAFGLSPIGARNYDLLALFHLAVLSVVFLLAQWSRRLRPAAVLGAASAYAAALLAVSLALAFGAPPYRCGGPRCATAAFNKPALRYDHRMLGELGIGRSCPLVVDDPDGWWPRLLAEPSEPAAEDVWAASGGSAG